MRLSIVGFDIGIPLQPHAITRLQRALTNDLRAVFDGREIYGIAAMPTAMYVPRGDRSIVQPGFFVPHGERSSVEVIHCAASSVSQFGSVDAAHGAVPVAILLR